MKQNTLFYNTLMTPKLLILFFTFILFLTPHFTYASCSINEDGEIGQESEIEFFTPENKLRYCDGTSWIDMTHSEVFALSCTSSSSLTSQLSAHYSFEDGAGGTLTDNEGSLNGTLTNFNTATAWVQGAEADQALDFDGNDDWVSFPSSASVNFTTLTISAWVKPDDVTSTQNGIILINNRNGTTRDLNYEIAIDGSGNGSSNDGNIRLTYYNSGYQDIVSSITPVIGVWQHVSITLDSNTDTYSFYLNGAQTDSGSIPIDMLAYSGTQLSIGRSDDTSNNDYYNGAIDSVRLYDRPLDPDEIEALYLLESGTCFSLSSHWKLDDTTGVNATNSISGSGDGTVNNTTFDAARVESVIDHALDLDGVDDYISITTSWRDLDEFTYSAWIKPASWGESDRGRIIHKGNSASQPAGGSFLICSNNADASCDEALRFEIGGTVGNGVWQANNAINLDEWQHVAVTFDKSATASIPKLYVNGTLQTLTYSQQPSSAFVADDNQMWIGSAIGTQRYFDGLIDDVRVYNYSLSPSQIKALHNCIHSGTQFYNATAKAMQWCDSIVQAYNMGDPDSGSGGCGSTIEGALNYNDTLHMYQFCDGNGWVPVPKNPDPPAVTFTDSDKDEVGASTITYNGLSFGAASTNRVIAVAISYRATASDAVYNLDSVSIGGIAATNAAQDSANERTNVSIWYAVVPTGTTGDVVLMPPQSSTSAVTVYSITELSSSVPTATDSDGSNSTVTTLSNTLNIDDEGVGFCIAANANDTDTINWTGAEITKNTNIQNGASKDHQHSAASIVNTSGSIANRTYTSDWSGSEYAAQACSSWK